VLLCTVTITTVQNTVLLCTVTITTVQNTVLLCTVTITTVQNTVLLCTVTITTVQNTKSFITLNNMYCPNTNRRCSVQCHNSYCAPEWHRVTDLAQTDVTANGCAVTIQYWHLCCVVLCCALPQYNNQVKQYMFHIAFPSWQWTNAGSTWRYGASTAGR